MTFWTSERVSHALSLAGGSPLTFSGVSTDTRTLEPGALFVALSGDRFDGHDYLAAARAAGATGAVVRTGSPRVEGLRYFEVPDTLLALGLLARERRRMIRGPVVGVTGTNGKTSTKEMLLGVLKTRWNVHGTSESLNNRVGVPLTILAAPPDCEALVVEAGANLSGEIGSLRDILEPTVGVVTNVSAGHLEGFGSLEGVLEEKVTFLAGVEMAVVGTEPPELRTRADALVDRVVSAGTDRSASVRPDKWGLNPDGRGWLAYGGHRVELSLVGRHQVENAMLAVAVATQLGVHVSEVAAALAQVSGPAGRCEIVRCGHLTILMDCYNSNPGSLRASLETAAALCGSAPLIVILGTMLELGTQSTVLHAMMAEEVLELDPQLVAASGEFVRAFEPHAGRLKGRLLVEHDPELLGRMVAERLEGDALVLVKGSRGVHLERAIPHLITNDETPCSTIS
ncbi:MAG: UDP-N-acetylmuramoyl-tripeptide--D-alanyl-D-alanine ligase [Gemmatimonadales bacterium]